MDLNFETDTSMPLRDVVFQTLRHKIITGEMKPGERLLEIQLSEQLGVSRTPIREAIRKLELEGLVVMEPRRGARVAPITAQDLVDVLEVRRVLESLAAELACRKHSEEDLEKMRTIMDAMAQPENKCESSQFASLDERFHNIIYASTGNKRLYQIMSPLREQLYWYRLEYVKNEPVRDDVLAEHEEIYDAIKNHDVKAAKKAMKLHIINQERAILKMIDSREEKKEIPEK
ncbi:MAG: GntR family transcriptional regulator [Lachnospiraceae bacterium]|nr:GntR family transcriptional regulator [Lachnospiraceae bacterium]